MTCPPGWEVLPPIADLSLEPMERKRVLLSLHRPLEDRGGEDRWLEWEFLPQSSENPHPSPARLAARVIDPTPDEP